MDYSGLGGFIETGTYEAIRLLSIFLFAAFHAFEKVLFERFEARLNRLILRLLPGAVPHAAFR